MRIKPPCNETGKPCDKRCIGCQATCEKYKEFRAKLDTINERRLMERKAAEISYDTIFKNRKALKKSPQGRRALAMR